MKLFRHQNFPMQRFFSSMVLRENNDYAQVLNIITWPPTKKILNAEANYESIKNGDAEEVGVYLILNKPIDLQTLPKVQIGNDVYERNVRLIQLIVLNDTHWSMLKDGSYVNLTGTLSHALTGHHHARVSSGM